MVQTLLYFIILNCSSIIWTAFVQEKTRNDVFVFTEKKKRNHKTGMRDEVFMSAKMILQYFY